MIYIKKFIKLLNVLGKCGISESLLMLWNWVFSLKIIFSESFNHPWFLAHSYIVKYYSLLACLIVFLIRDESRTAATSKMERFNFNHKAHRLWCCSSPRSRLCWYLQNSKTTRTLKPLERRQRRLFGVHL